LVKVAALQKLAKREFLLFVLVLKHHQLLLQDLVLEIGLIPQLGRGLFKFSVHFSFFLLNRLIMAVELFALLHPCLARQVLVALAPLLLGGLRHRRLGRQVLLAACFAPLGQLRPPRPGPRPEPAGPRTASARIGPGRGVELPLSGPSHGMTTLPSARIMTLNQNFRINQVSFSISQD